MKYILSLIVVLILASCQEKVKEDKKDAEPDTTEITSDQFSFPEELSEVFDSHGGFSKWKSFKALSYEMPKDGFSEIHTIDLYSRKDRVETPDYAMGFDGHNVWLNDPQDGYEGDPVFYHNLMFYFFAMPFVLGDDGIIYSETEDLIFEGRNYPGIGIGYQSDVGTSPKDEYYVHFDPETRQMAWLGYTVTYRTGEDSDNVKWIRYEDWVDVDGVLLPRSITWYDYEGRNIKSPKNTVSFENINLNSTAHDREIFEMPEGGITVLPKQPN